MELILTNFNGKDNFDAEVLMNCGEMLEMREIYAMELFYNINEQLNLGITWLN